MPGLSHLQNEFLALVQRRRALLGDAGAVRFANEHLTGSERLTPIEQLEIYREQFWLRHTAALVEDFPGVGGIVGQKDWEQLAEAYLSAHPPTSFTLRDLGQGLPRFIAEHGHFLDHRELVTDMARLEWAYVEVFDAKAPERLLPEALAGLSLQGLGAARLRFSPALRLLRVAYPVIELRKTILLAADEPVLLPETESLHLAIYRSDLKVLHERLAPAAFALLDALMQGRSFEMACEAACALGGEASSELSAHIGEWLAAWVERGWVVKVECLPEQTPA